MNKLGGLILVVVIWGSAFAQSELSPILTAEQGFERTVSSKGRKDAFLQFLSDDSVIFQPNATNGKEFWKSYDETSPMVLVRQVIDSDISSNGVLGYTTGNWRLYPKGKSEDSARYGEYVTIWEKRNDGKFFATVDISTNHEKLTFAETGAVSRSIKTSEPNNLGWSVADASMNFLRTSMTKDGLAGAYKKFGTDDVRLLIEREPPILGKKKAIKEMKSYISIEFPKKVALLEAGDMAYTWNPCQYANSNEGTESGNCLQVWKLRGEKWSIVLSVFARVTNETKPELKVKQKTKKNH